MIKIRTCRPSHRPASSHGQFMRYITEWVSTVWHTNKKDLNRTKTAMYLSVLINLCMCEDQIITIYGKAIKECLQIAGGHFRSDAGTLVGCYNPHTPGKVWKQTKLSPLNFYHRVSLEWGFGQKVVVVLPPPTSPHTLQYFWDFSRYIL